MNSLRIRTTGSSSLDTLQYPADSAMQAECIMQSFQNASVCALLCVSCITPLLKAVIYIFLNQSCLLLPSPLWCVMSKGILCTRSVSEVSFFYMYRLMQFFPPHLSPWNMWASGLGILGLLAGGGLHPWLMGHPMTAEDEGSRQVQ